VAYYHDRDARITERQGADGDPRRRLRGKEREESRRTEQRRPPPNYLLTVTADGSGERVTDLQRCHVGGLAPVIWIRTG
jgi:hypothetical protein